jgi:hypothetical protein
VIARWDDDEALCNAVRDMVVVFLPLERHNILNYEPAQWARALVDATGCTDVGGVLRIARDSITRKAATIGPVAATPMRANRNSMFDSSSPRDSIRAGSVASTGARFPRTPLAFGDGDGTIADGSSARIFVFDYIAGRKATAPAFFAHAALETAAMLAMQADLQRLTPDAGQALARCGFNLADLLAAPTVDIETALVMTSFGGDPARAWWTAYTAARVPAALSYATSGSALAQAIVDARRWQNDIAAFLDARTVQPGLLRQSVFPRADITYGSVMAEWVATVRSYVAAGEARRLECSLLGDPMAAKRNEPYATVHGGIVEALNQVQLHPVRGAARAHVAAVATTDERDDASLVMATTAATGGGPRPPLSAGRSAQRDEDWAKGNCFKCGKPGHRARECTSTAPGRTADSAKKASN